MTGGLLEEVCELLWHQEWATDSKFARYFLSTAEPIDPIRPDLMTMLARHPRLEHRLATSGLSLEEMNTLLKKHAAWLPLSRSP